MNAQIKDIPVLNRLEVSNERESLIRLSLSFEHAFAYETETSLGETYRFWSTAIEAGYNMPFDSLLDKRDHLSADGQAAISSVIDVSSDDPLDFIVTEHNMSTPFESYETMRLADVTSNLMRDALVLEYAQAKKGPPASMIEVHHWRQAATEEASNIGRHYVKIDLPMLDRDTGKVNSLLVVSRLLDENIVGLPRPLINSEIVL